MFPHPILFPEGEGGKGHAQENHRVPSAGEFVKVVALGRHMPEEQVRKLADGRIYTGMEAKELGLVDQVGYLEGALAAAASMAGVKDAAIVAYDRCDGFRGSIYANMPKIPSQINIRLDVPGLAKDGGAMFMYLWEPGAPR